LNPQKKKILKHLKAGLAITPIGALTTYGCFRLAARIYELRSEGWPIVTDRLKIDDDTVVARYWLDLDSTKWPSHAG
jgi:hypothetical protein